MSKLLVANFKMNPETAREAVRLAKSYDKKNVVVAPPFPFLAAVSGALKRAALGAQDAFYENEGAYTGEVSPLQLKRLGVRYVIIGHSERRALGETDEMVHKKVNAALAAGVKVILCVGEPLVVKKRGFVAAKKFVEAQLKKDLRGAKTHNLKPNTLFIAYEPIWAVGTGRAATPQDASAMARFIKSFLRTKPYTLNPTILYGGSTNAKNIGSFLAEPSIDGALVGGASLKQGEFRKMITVSLNLKPKT